MEWFRSWISGICAASILVSVVRSVAPKNTAGEVVQIIGASVLILSILAPFKRFDGIRFSHYQSNYESSYEELSGALERQNREIEIQIIEERLSAYISQQAKKLGVDCNAHVSVEKQKDGEIFPGSVSIAFSDANVTQEKIAELSRLIAADCGIPTANQRIVTPKG